MFRRATTRRNIRYQVVEAEGRRRGRENGVGERGETVDDRVVAEARRMERARASGKVVVYWRRMEQAKGLAERLGWAVFYSAVDGAEGKARRLREWMAAGRLMVATKAMGVGLDVADVRGVIHAGAPGRLRDYAQESGRGGRDGEASEAVLVHGGEAVGCDMAEFMEEGRWRRVVLEAAMDGRTDRVWCEEGEVRCDRCERREGFEAMAEVGEEEEGEDERQEEAAAENTAGMAAVGKAAREGAEVAELRRQLESWAGLWAGCWLAEAGEIGHGFDECPAKGEDWERVRAGAEGFREGLFGARRLERYSGCFHCGVPQEWCESWEAEAEDGGRYRRTGGRCQYKGMLETVVSGFWLAGQKGRVLVGEAMKRDGVDRQSREEGYKWFGRKIRWGGLETNNMWRVFYMLNNLGKIKE